MRALIVEDGLSPFILPVIRSLGRAGFGVGLAGPNPAARARASRHVRRWDPVASPAAGLEEFGAAVGDLVRRHGYDIVFGGDDIQVLALSAVRDRVGACVPHPEPTVLRRGLDKLVLARLAMAAGLDAPRTDEACAWRGSLPALVKARLHWTPGARTPHARLPVEVCCSVAAVEARVAAIEAAGGSAVVQELVDGDLMAVTVLLSRGGAVLAASQQRALRVSPRSGTSTRARSVAPDLALVERVRRMLTAAGWHGLVNLQFLQPDRGQPVLIDLNPRFYGSIGLAIAAGVDFPLLWARAALAVDDDGGAAAPQLTRPRVRYQSLEEDLRRARHERRHGLPADVVSTLAFAAGATHNTWSRTDRRPAVQLVRELAVQAGAGLTSRHRAPAMPGPRPAPRPAGSRPPP